MAREGGGTAPEKSYWRPLVPAGRLAEGGLTFEEAIAEVLNSLFVARTSFIPGSTAPCRPAQRIVDRRRLGFLLAGGGRAQLCLDGPCLFNERRHGVIEVLSVKQTHRILD